MLRKYTPNRRLTMVAVAVAVPALAWSRSGDVKPIQVSGFTCKQEVILPGTPEEIFDAVTGDVSGWWDHTFSGSPLRLTIEPKPGGGFYEIFDATGDGVLHATVTAAHRGKLLRFVGPLGLAGHAVHMVHNVEFEAVGDSTRLSVSVHAVGEIQDGWPEAVKSVWHHFLVERLKPYVEWGRHRRKGR